MPCFENLLNNSVQYCVDYCLIWVVTSEYDDITIILYRPGNEGIETKN